MKFPWFKSQGSPEDQIISYARREYARHALVEKLDDLFIDLFVHGSDYAKNYEKRRHAITRFVDWFHDQYLAEIDFPERRILA